jgi:hypothetical protein
MNRYKCQTKKILMTGGLLMIFQCTFSQDCNRLPTSFANYDQALGQVKSASFKINERVNTSKSSWIRGATYYSCDSKIGFLIVKRDKKDYLHQNVPIEIWHGFKNANSSRTEKKKRG